MFGFHRTGVTATASTQSGICTDVSGDTWLDESRRTDAAATTRSATTARGRDAMCESASTVHAIKESVNGRHQDGIRRDGYQGAVTMAVLGTNYARWHQKRWMPRRSDDGRGGNELRRSGGAGVGAQHGCRSEPVVG